jgi:hypothetical protein
MLGAAVAASLAVAPASANNTDVIQTNTNDAVYVSPYYQTGLHPTDIIGIAPGGSYAGTYELSDDGRFKYWTRNGERLVAHNMFCGGPGEEVEFSITVAPDGLARIRCWR